MLSLRVPARYSPHEIPDRGPSEPGISLESAHRLARCKLPPQLCSSFTVPGEKGERGVNAPLYPRRNLERRDGRDRRRTGRERTGPLRGGPSACAARTGAQPGGRRAGRDCGPRQPGPGATRTVAARALPSRGAATCACSPGSAGCSPGTSAASARRGFVTCIQLRRRAGAARAPGLPVPAPPILPPLP